MRKLLLTACGLVVIIAGMTVMGCNSGAEPTKSKEGEVQKTGDKGAGTPPPVTEEKPVTK